MSLDDLQRRFGDALRAPSRAHTAAFDSAAQATVAAPAKAEPCEYQEFAEATIAPSARLSATAQLEIYREQYERRHLASLREDYASVVHYLGQAQFDALARAYLLEYPPTHFSLQKLGNSLPEFVCNLPEFRSDRLLCDLVRVEEAFLFAWDAADAPPFDPAALSAVPEASWPLVRVHLHPSVRLLRLHYEAHLYRASVRTQSVDSPSGAFGAASTATSEGMQAESVVAFRAAAIAPIELVIARGATTLEFMAIDPPQWALLERLHAGAPLGAACEAVMHQFHLESAAFETELEAWFGQWTRWKWIASSSTQA
jgi:Putative DNA-binding domain